MILNLNHGLKSEKQSTIKVIDKISNTVAVGMVETSYIIATSIMDKEHIEIVKEFNTDNINILVVYFSEWNEI